MDSLDVLMSGVRFLSEFTGRGRSMTKTKWVTTLKTLESGTHVEQFMALNELSTFLSYSSEESLLGFPSWSYIRVLMHTINTPRVKYCDAKAASKESTQEDSDQGIKSPFYEIINAIYNNRIRTDHPETESSPPTDDPSSASDNRNEVPASESPEAQKEKPQEAAEDDLINDELAANKAISAATCLNALLDIVPQSANFFMSNTDQLDILKDKLQDIQYIDLAEIILMVFEKLVKEIPISVVKSKSLVAMLAYVDFFPTDIQIGTYTSILTAIRKVERPESCRIYLIPLVSYISQALDSSNKKIVQLSCTILKMIVAKCVHASKSKGANDGIVSSDLVQAILDCNALKTLCRLVFHENGRLRRFNINQCLYSLIVVSNKSNEATSRILELDILQYLSRWLVSSPEATVAKIVDLGLALIGSYSNAEPFSNGTTNVFQRSEYFRQQPDQLKHVLAAFPISTLMVISENILSQHLRDRIMMLQWRVIEFSTYMEFCSGQIPKGLPLTALVGEVCYILRYHTHEEQCKVAIHLLSCLLKLIDHATLFEILGRHGIHSLLGGVTFPDLLNEVDYISQAIPRGNIKVAPKSGIDLICDIKCRGDEMTLCELIKSGTLSLNYDDLLSVECLKSFITSVLLHSNDEAELTNADVDIKGISSLWNSFARLLETQPEFMFSMNVADEKIILHVVNSDDVKVMNNNLALITGDIAEPPDDYQKEKNPTLKDEESTTNKSSKPKDADAPLNGGSNTLMRELVSSDTSDYDDDDDDEDEDEDEDEEYPQGRNAEAESQRIHFTNEDADSQSLTENERAISSTNTSSPASKDGPQNAIDVLMNLYEGIIGSGSASTSEGRAIREIKKSHSKRSDGTNKSATSSGNVRNKIRGALGMIRRMTTKENLPFPLSHIDRDIKLKLKCINKIEELGAAPTINVYTSPLVSVAKMESYVVKYLNKRIKKQVEESSLAPKKRTKTDQKAQKEGGGAYTTVQLYYKGIALAPTVPLYQVLFAYRAYDDKHIWDETNVLQFEAMDHSAESELHKLQSGRYTPLMAAVCEDRHSAVGLYMDFLGYVNGYDARSPEANLARLKEKLSALESVGSPNKIQCVLDKARKHQSSFRKMELDMGADEKITESASHGNDVTGDMSSVEARSDINMGYFLKRITGCLKRMDMIWKGDMHLDSLAASSPTCNTPDMLSEDSRKHLRMLALLNSLISELQVFIRGANFGFKYSRRLTLKLLTVLGKLEDSLCYRTPKWIIKLAVVCPSLFSLESRRVLFDVLAAGPQRVMSQFTSRLYSLLDADCGASKEPEGVAVHALDEVLTRKVLANRRIMTASFQNLENILQIPKVRTSCCREEVLLDAMLVMNQVVNMAAELDAVPKVEISFDNEMGSGAGPTQEFYSLVVEDIVQFKTKEGKLLDNLDGYLYPSVRMSTWISPEELGLALFRRHSPTDNENAEESTKSLSAFSFQMFKLLGQFCASALIDKKLLTVPMHPLFWLLCQQPNIEKNCSLSALKSVDPELAKSLENLYTVQDLESAELYFVYKDIAIIPGGEDIKVTRSNLSRYIEGIVRLRLYDGVKMQVWAFRMGFGTILPLESLALFTPNELADHVFGVKDHEEYWTSEHLQTYIIPEHGYDTTSLPYRELIEVLSSLSANERRMFVMFCTGAPVLPKGGFASLTPIMKVVNKGENTDELPSVMTCSNYLKLPNYKSGEQLREKLIQAIKYGQKSFNLS